MLGEVGVLGTVVEDLEGVGEQSPDVQQVNISHILASQTHLALCVKKMSTTPFLGPSGE